MTPTRRLLRGLRIGAWIGGAAGTLFAIAVVLFADCSGPDCLRERITGVLLHALAGAISGSILGFVGGALWNVFSRKRVRGS